MFEFIADRTLSWVALSIVGLILMVVVTELEHIAGANKPLWNRLYKGANLFTIVAIVLAVTGCLAGI